MLMRILFRENRDCSISRSGLHKWSLNAIGTFSCCLRHFKKSYKNNCRNLFYSSIKNSCLTLPTYLLLDRNWLFISKLQIAFYHFTVIFNDTSELLLSTQLPVIRLYSTTSHITSVGYVHLLFSLMLQHFLHSLCGEQKVVKMAKFVSDKDWSKSNSYEKENKKYQS